MLRIVPDSEVSPSVHLLEAGACSAERKEKTIELIGWQFRMELDVAQESMTLPGRFSAGTAHQPGRSRLLAVEQEAGGLKGK
jgi:hypothetical protein